MSDEPPADFDRETTGNELVNWLNAHGPDWVLEVELLGNRTQYVGFVDGRLRNHTADGQHDVALGYVDDVADDARTIRCVAREDSPFAESDDE